jgi:hypothetical protein
VSGVPAWAQDGSEPTGQRTVESAQAFLSELLTQSKGYLVYPLGSHVAQFRDQRGRLKADPSAQYFEHEGVWNVTSVDAPRRCVTRITLDGGPATFVRGYDDTVDWISTPALKVVEIDWSLVTKVDLGAVTRGDVFSAYWIAFGAKTWLAQGKGSGSPPWVTLAFSVPQETWTRITFAGEFLRTSCAMKSSTGF